MDLSDAMALSTAGLKAQGTRLRVIAENLANTDSTAAAPGDLPYRRKVVLFENVLDKALGIDAVKIRKIDVDRSDFERRYDPGHPSADADGYVLTPNVNGLVETMDMKEAQRSYEANLSVIDATRQMMSKTIALLQS